MNDLSPNQTAPQLFLKRAALHPDKVAMREKDLGRWTEITWKQYSQHVEDFCLGLISLGLQKGDHVCIHGENSQEWLYADLAVQSAGGVSVGVYPTNPPDEVKYLASHSDAMFYVAQDQEQVDKILEVKDGVPSLKKIIVWNMRGLRNYQEPMLISFKEVEELGRQLKAERPGLFMERVGASRPDDEMLIIYTSGTTGPPKGTVHTHRSLLNGSKTLSDILGLNEDDHFLSYLPLCHTAERVISGYLPLFCGANISFGESTQTIQKDLVEVSPSFLLLFPRIMEKTLSTIKVKIDDASLLKRFCYRFFLNWGLTLADKRMKKEPISMAWRLREFLAYWCLLRQLKDKFGFKKCKSVVTGGASVAPELMRFFRGIGVPIRQIFGQTETILVFMPDPDDIKYDTVGSHPVKGCEWKFSEDQEILIKWIGNFKGYFKEEELTRQTIDEDGWVHTGDIGALDEDGHLKIIDRKKNILITSSGKNITPEFIENKLKAGPYISEAIVIGEARPYLTAMLQIDFDVMAHWAETNRIAYTTLRDLSRNQAVVDLISGVVNRVNEELSRVEQIKKFRLIDIELDHESGELTATMKIKRKILETKFKSEIKLMYGH